MPYKEQQPKRPIKSWPARFALSAVAIFLGAKATACNRTPPPPPEPTPATSSEWGCATITETGGDDLDQTTAGNPYAGAVNVADANQLDPNATSYDVWYQFVEMYPGYWFNAGSNLALKDLKEVKNLKSLLGTLIQVCLSGSIPSSKP